MARDQIDMTPLQSRDELVAPNTKRLRSRSKGIGRSPMKARAASARCSKA
jgi:hypothetical protein